MRILFIAMWLFPGLCLAAIPRPDHVVVVIEENHSYSEIIGNSQAPYINALAAQGSLFTQSFAVTHPSQPNYIALFSGSTQGNTDDSCPNTFSAPNLGSSLIAASLSFIGYSEDLPDPGSKVCTSGAYARKHNPWVNFTDVPDSSNLPFSSFPSDFSQLPTVAFVVPNQNNDMHNGTIAQGDTWLKNNLDAFVQWAQTHNSLLILTFDEDDGSENNRIVTLFVGPMVLPGQYADSINHYNVLRTIEDMYGLTPVGTSANVSAISSALRPIEGSLPEGPSVPMDLNALSIKLDFAHSGNDSIRLRLRLPVPEGFVPAMQQVRVDVGGVARTFTLDSHGNSRMGNDQFRLNLKRSHGITLEQSARLNLSLSHGDFRASLSDEGLTDSNVRNEGRTISCGILFNGVLYRGNRVLIYSATQGKTGRAK